jgi:hypothetical protein
MKEIKNASELKRALQALSEKELREFSIFYLERFKRYLHLFNDEELKEIQKNLIKALNMTIP